MQVWPGPLPLGGRGLTGLRAHGGRRRLRPGDAPGPLQSRARGHWGGGGRGQARQPRRPRVSLPGIAQTEVSSSQYNPPSKGIENEDDGGFMRHAS